MFAEKEEKENTFLYTFLIFDKGSVFMIKFPAITGQEKPLRESKTTSLELIPIDKIHPNPYQPRKYFELQAIADLSASIKQLGLLQPINVRRVGNAYELIAGERRLRACKMAGYTHVRALITVITDKESAMLALVENMQRENLHFFEEAEGFMTLIKEHGLTQEDLARRLSKNQSTIANKLRILRLPKQIKQKVKEYSLTERHARALLRLHNEEAQMRLVEKVAKEGLSVKSTEALVEAELQNLYGEVEKIESGTLRIKCNNTIYLNTIRKCLRKIQAYGANTELVYKEEAEHLKVEILIGK